MTTLEETAIRASITLLVLDEYQAPVKHASGFMIKHRDRIFLVSVKHLTDDLDKIVLDLNQPVFDENSFGSNLMQLGGVSSFDSIRIENNTLEIEEIDLIFCELKSSIEIKQEVVSSPLGEVWVEDGGTKITLNSMYLADFDNLAGSTYYFAGKTQMSIQNGIRLCFSQKIEQSTTYLSNTKDRFLLASRNTITDLSLYQGCSGAPVIDENERLLGMVLAISLDGETIWVMDIRYILSMIDMTIDIENLS